jgi:hypothetical protein
MGHAAQDLAQPHAQAGRRRRLIRKQMCHALVHVSAAACRRWLGFEEGVAQCLPDLRAKHRPAGKLDIALAQGE